LHSLVIAGAGLKNEADAVRSTLAPALAWPIRQDGQVQVSDLEIR
jgi:hypothetical protein